MANCSSDLSYMHDEFVELLWDNGPVIQGPSRPRKSSSFTSLSPSGDRVSEKDNKDIPFPKIGYFRATEPKLNNFPSSGSPAGFGINAQDDDIVRWIYPIEDPLHNDYCTEFLDDYSRVDLNSTHSGANTVPVIRGSFIDQAVRDSHNVEQGHASETSRIRASQPFQLPTQFKSSVPSAAKSSEMDISIGNSSKALKESGVAVVNFSHFSRPVALARANVEGVDRLKGNNKAACVMSSNPMDSTVIEYVSGLKTVVGTQDQLSSVQPNGDLKPSPKPPMEMILPGKSKAVCEGEISRKNGNPNSGNTLIRSPERVQSSSFAASVALGRHENEKGNEAVVASSSVCSGCSAGAASNDHKHTGKKKCHEGEESGYQSEDLEDESVDLRKSGTIQGKSKKRSRAAEVHNLSERRRRDRINERMHALQELIPNCSKTDKASMLDEAIEYLKSLQMQVQIMSMGGGLCMPPMMMQHMQAPTMAHFSPMGIKMGMGMGMGLTYGVGMYDMNGSPGCSFIPVSPIQGPQFACPPIAGPRGLHGVPGPNSLQMFGIPVQGLPVPMPYRPPCVSSADTNTIPVAATKSENQQQQNKTLGKTKRSDTDDLHI